MTRAATFVLLYLARPVLMFRGWLIDHAWPEEDS